MTPFLKYNLITSPIKFTKQTKDFIAMQIIRHLLALIQVQKNTILFVLKFICSYVPRYSR